MIAKLIGVKSQLASSSSLAAGHARIVGHSWSVFNYVGGFQLEQRDIERLQELSQVASYPVDSRGNPERILDRKALKLKGADWDQRAVEFAFVTARYGEKALKHITVSYRPGQVNEPMARRHLETFLKVMGAENCAGLYAMHGDTPNHPHWHLALCAYDLTNNKLGAWGQGYEIEALHIALAICERDDDLPREPNSRYMADASGVRHTLSGLRVADAEGRILTSSRMKRVPGLQFEVERQIRTPQGMKAGMPVPASLSLKILAKAATKECKNWEELHRRCARLGIRYELHRAADNTVGAHFVTVGLPPEDSAAMKGSQIHAGYGKLVQKFGNQPFQPAPQGLRFHTFQTLGYVDEPQTDTVPAQRNAENEERAKEDERLAALAAALRERHAADGRSTIAAQKAREAKRRKREGFQVGGPDFFDSSEDAQYRQEERDIVGGLKRAIKRDRGDRRGAPSKKDTVEAIIWGDAPDDPDREPYWLDKYSPLRSCGVRSYYEGSAVAFSETRNFVSIRSGKREHLVDALRLAQLKFGTVKVEGTRRHRRKLIQLAIEMNIPLDASNRKEADRLAAHLGRAIAAQIKGEEPASPLVAPTPTRPQASVRETPTQPNKPSQQDIEESRRLIMLQYHAETDRRERARRVRDFKLYKVNDPKTLTSETHRIEQPSESQRAVKARAQLNSLNRNDLVLTASKEVKEGFRFLDDPALLESFKSDPHMLMLPEIQTALAAIAACQYEQRRWILAAFDAERVEMKDGALRTREVDNWASDFWKGLNSDPNFQLELAARIPNSLGSRIDLDEHPGMAAWRKANRAGDEKLARAIAYELDREARNHAEALLKQRGNQAKADTEIRRQEFANEYRKAIARTLSPGEKAALSVTPALGIDYVSLRPWKVLVSYQTTKRTGSSRSQGRNR